MTRPKESEDNFDCNCSISDYWIVDPMHQRVTILEWVEGLDEGQVFAGAGTIASSLFAPLSLTPIQLLQGRAA